MIMCVLLCYPVSIHMSQVQATGRPISSFFSSDFPKMQSSKNQFSGKNAETLKMEQDTAILGSVESAKQMLAEKKKLSIFGCP